MYRVYQDGLALPRRCCLPTADRLFRSITGSPQQIYAGVRYQVPFGSRAGFCGGLAVVRSESSGGLACRDASGAPPGTAGPS